jgi:hypothetical protein
MTFELKIEFAGLCLFTRDADAEWVAVLMPDARPADETPRAPVFAFDRAYLSEGSTEPAGSKVYVELRRASLDVDAGGAAPVLPPAMIDLGAFANGAAIPDARVVARVALRGGTLEQAVAPSWRYADAEPGAPILAVTRWTGEHPGDTLRLDGVPMDAAATPSVLPPLYPINGSIHLRVENLPADGIPHAESAILSGEAADDFSAFYQLYEKTQAVGHSPAGKLMSIKLSLPRATSAHLCLHQPPVRLP